MFVACLVLCVGIVSGRCLLFGCCVFGVGVPLFLCLALLLVVVHASFFAIFVRRRCMCWFVVVSC